MSQFKSKFVVHFIIDSLVLGILFTLLFRFVGAALSNGMGGETTVCLPIVLSTMLANVFSFGISVFLTQNTLYKNGITDAPQSMPFYLILAVVLITLDVVFFVLGFSVLEGWCNNNISITVSAETVRPAVRNAVIVSDIVQAVLLLCFVSLWKKRHDVLFGR